MVTLTTPLLGEKYRKDSRIANLSRKVTDDLSKLRCEMDDVLAEEHPGEPYQKVYYGHKELIIMLVFRINFYHLRKSYQ